MTSTTAQYGLFPPSWPTGLLLAFAAVGLAAWVAAHVLERALRRGRWPWQAAIAGFAVKALIGAVALTLVAEVAGRLVLLASSLPIWLICLAAAAAVEGALWLYRLERAAMPTGSGVVLAVLRTALVLAVAAILAQPVLRWPPSETITPQVAVLIDESQSMYVTQAQLLPSERMRLAEALGLVSRPVRLDEHARGLDAAREALAVQGDMLAAWGQAAAGVRASRMAANRSKLTAALKKAKRAADEHAEALGKPLGAKAIAQAVPNGIAGVRKALTDDVGKQLAEAIGLVRKAEPAELAKRHDKLVRGIRAAQTNLARLCDELTSLGTQLDEAYYRGLDAKQKASVDSVASMTRYELARRILTRPGGLLEKLGEDYDVKLYTFAQRADEVALKKWAGRQDTPAAAALPADRRRTDLAGALKKVISDMPGDRLVGVVMVGDGRHNAPEDPRVHARRLAGTRAKLCAVVAGGALPPRDAAVVALEGPETVCVKDKLRMTADVKLDGLAGKKIRLTLMDGKRQVDSRTLQPSGSSWRSRLEFNDTPTRRGPVTYKLTIKPSDGEAIAENNTATLTVSVTPDRTKLLIIEGRPRWEFRYLKNLFASRDRSVRLQYVLLRPDRVADAKGEPPIAASASRPPELTQATMLPAGPDEWLKFDVIVLGDVPPAGLGAKAQDALSRFVNDRGGTLIVLAGANYMPHAFTDTPLVKLLPVTFTKALPPLRDGGYQLSLTEAGKTCDVFAVASGRRRDTDVWESLPKLYWRHRLVKTKPAATTLAYALVPQPPDEPTSTRPRRVRKEPAWERQQRRERENPLVTSHNVGWGKVMFLAFDRTWRTRYRAGDRHHHRFWGQVMRWATAGKLPAGTNLVKVGTDRRRYAPGRRVEVRAQLLKHDLSPIVSKDVRVNVIKPGKKAGEDERVLHTELSYVKDSPGMYIGQFGPLPAGQYRVELDAPDAKASLGGSGVKTVAMDFVVEATSNAEQTELGVDRASLTALVNLTRGRVAELSAAQRVCAAITSTRITPRETKEWPLWQSWPLLALIVALGAGEWLLRKKEGLP